MKKIWNKVLLSAVILGGLAGCAGETDTVIMAPLPQVTSQFTPQTVWKTSIGDGVGHYFSKLTPVYEYGKVFVASRAGLIKALDPENGQVLWETDLEDEVIARLSGGIMAAYGQIFIGSENGEVIALDADNGEINWRVQVGGEVLSAPTADDNLIMVNTSRGILLALDQTTGKQVWDISTEVPSLSLRGDSTPSAVAGGVFWGTANGRLAAAAIQQGQIVWQQPVGTPQGATEIDRLVDVDSSPLIIGSMLYTVGINGQLTAIDLRSGQPVWKRKYSSALDMTTDGQTIYLDTDHDHLVAVDARSGTELWQNSQLENRLLTAPTLINGELVVGDSEGYLHWLDRTTGEFVAQQEVDDSGFAVGPIALDDGYVIVMRDGSVQKLTVDN